MKLLSRCNAVVAIAGFVLSGLLGGCALPKAAQKPAETHTGALLVVRLADRLETPSSVQVEVSLLREGSTALISAQRHHSVPGRHADYLVALALPAQRYVITALREPAQSADGPGAVLAVMSVPFEVKNGGPAYLGRLVVAPDTARTGAGVQAQDHFDDDTLLFRSAVTALRGVPIERAVIPSGVLASAVASPRPAAGALVKANGNGNGRGNTVIGGRELSVDVIGSGAEAALAPSARDAFARFLRLKAPRAFAVAGSDARAFAYSGGSGAVERAMRECSRLAAGRSCRLFAVDDTLMAPAACEISTEAASCAQTRTTP